MHPLEQYADSNPLTVERWTNYGLDIEALQNYSLRDISQEEAASKGFSTPANGIYITYPQDENSRIRYHRTGFQAQSELGKYGQRKGTPPALYVPPLLAKTDWKNNTSLPVILTEGEFKAIVLDVIVNSPGQTKFLPCAVGGVSSWQSSKLGWQLLPELEEAKLGGRTVYLAFDMDAATNPQVSLALSKLFNKLSSKGARCYVLMWDAKDGKGIDDYLTSCPLPQESWNELVTKAQLPIHILTVLKMNNRFVYVEKEQKVYDIQNAGWIQVRSFGSEFFTEKFKVQTGVKLTAAGAAPVMTQFTNGSYWLQSPLRNTVAGMQFVPGAASIVEQESLYSDVPVKHLNTWRGWGAGLDSRPLKPQQGNVEPFYKFIRATFGHESPEHAEYLVKRIAWMFQQPTNKHPTWIYLIGAPLQGKSSLIKLVSALIGTSYVSNIDESSMKSSFSEWRAEKLLITLDDTAVKDRLTIQQLLKRLTTEENSQINKKYQSEYTAPNYSTFFFAANGIDALIEHDDRRALVLEAMCPWDFAAGEWKEFDTWRQSHEGKAALLHHLLYEVKLDAEFYNAKPPHTNARTLVIESGESSWDMFLHNIATSMRPMTWRSPASGELRKWDMSILTMDMLRTLYELTCGKVVDKFPIKNGSLTAKLTRYGARKAIPYNATDNRGRIMIGDQQLTLWTWNKAWVNKGREDYIDEYFSILKHFPELDDQSIKHSKY